MSNLTVVYHESYLTSYYTSTVECPARVKAVHAKLKERYPIAQPEPAERGDVLRVHSASLVSGVQAEGRDTYECALMAAGGAILASEQALQGNPAFALVRPPGHHAGPDKYWGFCFFNNIAVALARLMARGAIARALVLDLDLHHGDGTEAIFEGSQTVRVVNVRADTRTAYLDVVAHELEKAVETDLVAISAGFDTYIHDWGGLLQREDYREIATMVRAGAKRLSQGRYFAVLEGGYYLPDLAMNVLAFCEGLAGC